MSKHTLPGRITSYLRRLSAEYKSDPTKSVEVDLLTHCRARVEEETDYDNWNGGTYGHDVWLYVPLQILARIGLRNLEPTQQSLLDDLNLLARSTPSEYFRAVQLEEIDEEDFGYQIASPISAHPALQPDKVDFWRPGLVRLFISHRDTDKRAAKQLAASLERYGVSCFVAHDTITPMSEWRKEIMKGLETMEAMLVFLTDAFEASTFTNQEIGYALGASKPIISLKLESRDPPGFISHEQALRGKINDPDSCARALYPLLAKAIGNPARMNDGLVSAFASSSSFDETRDRFETMSETIDKLEEHHVSTIVSAYRTNDQLHNSIYLNNNRDRLRKYLSRAAGRQFEISGTEIKEIRSRRSDEREIPF